MSGKVEIPETPEVISSTRTRTYAEIPTLATEATPSMLSSAQGVAPLPWFQSGLAASAPKITQKKVGQVENVETAFTHSMNFETNHLHSSSHAPSLRQTANEVSQIFVPKSKSDVSSETARSKPGVNVRHAADQDTTIPEVIAYGGSDQHGASDDKVHLPGPECVKAANKQVILTVSDANSEAPSASVPTQNVHESSTKASVLRQVSAGSSASMTMDPATRLAPTANAPTAIVPDTVANSTVGRKYTLRQLIRIALVGANGLNMTTSQIILWLAHTFPYLRIGEGPWEGGIRSMLSNSPEFRGQRIAGVHGNKKLYGFTTADLRLKYEAEYPQYRAATPGSHTTATRDHSKSTQRSTSTSTTDEARKTGAPPSRMARKCAPSLPTPKSNQGQPVPAIATKHEMQIQVAPERSKSSALMPFERSRKHQSLRALQSALGVSRERKIQDVVVLAQQAVDSMADVEKARKIAEIKARPSRKKYFGSNYKLAHKRRYGLQDIHDEREGAWTPSPIPNHNRLEAEKDIDMNDENAQTLREAFELPDKVIPMNDGYTELAFRDGALVSQLANVSHRSRY